MKKDLFEVITDTPEATMQYAKTIGTRLKGNEVIELIGDVGAGKTTFVRGLASGAGSQDLVSSPTFTISNVYKGNITINHYDLYRLHNDGLIDNELEELLHDQQGVIVLEWAGQVQGILPFEKVVINVEATGEYSRKLSIRIPDTYNYLELS